MNPIILCVVCALTFGVWPTLAKYTNLSTGTIATIVSGSTFLFVAIISQLNTNIRQEIRADFEVSPSKVFLLLIFAGMINAVGMVIYGYLLDNNNGLETSKIVPTISALVPVFSIISAVILLSEGFTLQKFVAVCILVIGIILLTTQKKYI